MEKVFIDGSAGTTGLRIRERLSSHRDIETVVLPEELRKDVNARRDALDSCDVAFLCLPDAAAVESVSLVSNPSVTIIDTSTAHRTADGWEYGFPELAGRRERIAASKRIANPGCHASGFVALVEPLVRAGVIAASARLCAFSLTGYSGGGKKMIADYGEKLASGDVLYSGGRQYALGQTHKHLPEMAKICGLENPPVFSPVVVPHFSGMQTVVQLFGGEAKGGLDAIRRVLSDAYSGPGVVRFAEEPPADGFVSSAAASGRDSMVVSAFGNGDRIVLVSVFDNLGKGASGAAVQNMNIVLGRGETEGLDI